VDGLTRLAAEIFSDAGEGARYDASDLMPVEIGGNGGAFPTAMTAFFSGESIATVLEAVEAAWPAE
jgi:hypothetical protein